MSDDKAVVDIVRAALHSEPRVHPTGGPIHLAFSNRELLMEGEVDHSPGRSWHWRRQPACQGST